MHLYKRTSTGLERWNVKVDLVALSSLLTLLAEATNAVKDKAKRCLFAGFIEAERGSLTVFDATTSKSDNVLFVECVASLDTRHVAQRGHARHQERRQAKPGVRSI